MTTPTEQAAALVRVYRAEGAMAAVYEMDCATNETLAALLDIIEAQREAATRLVARLEALGADESIPARAFLGLAAALQDARTALALTDPEEGRG